MAESERLWLTTRLCSVATCCGAVTAAFIASGKLIPRTTRYNNTLRRFYSTQRSLPGHFLLPTESCAVLVYSFVQASVGYTPTANFSTRPKQHYLCTEVYILPLPMLLLIGVRERRSMNTPNARGGSMGAPDTTVLHRSNGKYSVKLQSVRYLSALIKYGGASAWSAGTNKRRER